MTQGRPVSDADRSRVLELHAEGLSRNEVARRAGLAPSTVSSICRDAGASFDRSRTREATAARAADLAEGRLRLAARMLDKVEGMLDRLDDPYLVFNFGGKDNAYAEHTLDLPPVEVERNVIAAAGIVFDKVTRVVERDNGGTDEALGVLDGLAVGFRQVADLYRRQDAEELSASTSHEQIKEIDS